MNTFFSRLFALPPQEPYDLIEGELSPEEGSTTVEYAIGAVATICYLGRIWLHCA